MEIILNNSDNSFAEGQGWIQTYSGVRFEILNPTTEMINRTDIAHALSLICRFNGHTRFFYSVAQHSLLVKELISIELCDNKYNLLTDKENLKLQLYALLHDASEAYIGDITRPLKKLAKMSSYRDIEKNLEYVIAQKFGLSAQMPQLIKDMDNLALMVEARDLMSPLHKDWLDVPKNIDHIGQIYPMFQSLCESKFLGELHILEKRIKEMDGIL